MDVPPWAWISFGTVLLALLVVDLFVHRGGRAESMKHAVTWSVIWIVTGLAFSFFVWHVLDRPSAERYLAAYLIEKSLSVDNLFVFLIIFHSLRIPYRYQRTALSWGIFGALVFRAIFVFAGAAALRQWHWVEYVFGGILLLAALRTLWGGAHHEADAPESKLMAMLSRRLPMSTNRETSKFFVRENGSLRMTPLLVAVIALEATDILFAIDSVPAALSVTRREFVVYSSNAFAILGLRSLYLVLTRTIAGFRFLHFGLAGVLAFAAVKMIGSRWIELPPLVSVAIIVVLIGGSVAASLVWPRREESSDGALKDEQQ